MGTITITVNLFAGLGKSLQDYSLRDGLNLDVEENTTVRDILNSLNISYKDIALVVINGKRNALSVTVREGDRVDIFPPVGGG